LCRAPVQGPRSGPWGNVCLARARRATFVLRILSLAPRLSSPREVPQVDRTRLQTFRAKHKPKYVMQQSVVPWPSLFAQQQHALHHKNCPEDAPHTLRAPRLAGHPCEDACGLQKPTKNCVPVSKQIPTHHCRLPVPGIISSSWCRTKSPKRPKGRKIFSCTGRGASWRATWKALESHAESRIRARLRNNPTSFDMVSRQKKTKRGKLEMTAPVMSPCRPSTVHS
jgi:hypothetical protein